MLVTMNEQYNTLFITNDKIVCLFGFYDNDDGMQYM